MRVGVAEGEVGKCVGGCWKGAGAGARVAFGRSRGAGESVLACGSPVRLGFGVRHVPSVLGNLQPRRLADLVAGRPQ